MNSKLYNSFLYGYGLTLAVLNHVSKSINIPSIDKYIDFNIFFYDFIQAEEHKRILRDFNKYFKLNSDTIKTHLNTRKYLCHKVDEISKLGFERWVSKNLFKKDNKVSKDVQFYVYVLYNYWYHFINEKILSNSKVVNLLEKISDLIKQKITMNSKIYTLNFDTILDKYLNPKHLHGVFTLPLTNIKDLILSFSNEKEFEYVYLFGSNGIEKLSRLDKIRNSKQNKYDLEFFYDRELYLSHLLIYGISLGNTEFINNEFLKTYPEHEKVYYIRSVDGHILLKLNQLYNADKIEKITLAYYSQDDLIHYKNIIGFTDFKSIVEYKQCNEIFNFNKLNKFSV